MIDAARSEPHAHKTLDLPGNRNLERWKTRLPDQSVAGRAGRPVVAKPEEPSTRVRVAGPARALFSPVDLSALAFGTLFGPRAGR